MRVDTVPVWQGLVSPGGRVFCVPVKGQKLVLPAKTNTKLVGNNEFILDPNRLTVAESPWGGLKGSARDYAPGTVSTATSGVYLTDVNGANTSKILTAGKLKELNLLTVDTAAKTITEEFIIQNTSTDNGPYTICNCDSLSYWVGTLTTLALDTANMQEGAGCLSGTCTTAGNMCMIYDPPGSWDLSNYAFLTLWIKGTAGRSVVIYLQSSTNYIAWSITTNGAWQKLVLPLNKPPTKYGTLNLAAVGYLYLDLISAAVGDTMQVDNISADVGKSAYVEIDTPDFLADSSLQIQAATGSSYATIGSYKLDSNYAAVGTPTSANWVLNDGTKLDNVYGANLGRALYPKSVSGKTVTGSSGTMTFSNNKGCKNRVGLRVDLPPSDNGRTAFNQVRLKTVINYTDSIGNKVPDISGNELNGTLTGSVVKNRDSISLGIDGIVSFGAVPAINNLTDYTYITKLKFNSSDLSGHVLSTTDGASNAPIHSLLFEAGIMKVTVAIAAPLFQFGTLTSVGDNAAHWVAISCKSNGDGTVTYTGRVDDSKETYSTTAAADLPLNSQTVIGSRYVGAVTHHCDNAVIYSAYIFPTALSDSEYTSFINGPSDTPVFGVVFGSKNPGASSYEFEDSSNASYGLQNMALPWVALLDSSGRVECYVFTDRPNGLTVRRDDSGNIYELEIDPGNSLVYRFVTWIGDQTTDTDADLIPDCLAETVKTSLVAALAGYAFNA